MSLQLVGVIALPYALNWVMGWWNRRNQPPSASQPVPRKPLSEWDLTVLGALSLVAAGSLVAAFASTNTANPNLVSECGLSVHTTSQQMETCLQRFPSKAATIESLRKSKEARFALLKFGQNVFEGCGWCRYEVDFFVFASPSLATEYLLVALILGLCTAQIARAKRRLWVTVGLVGGALGEAFLLLLHDGTQKAGNGSIVYDPWTLAFTAFWRRVGFAALSCALIFLDTASTPTDAERLAVIAEREKLAFSRLQGARLATHTVFNDTRLRNKFVDFHRAAQAVQEAATDDAEFKRKRTEFLKTLDVKSMIQNSQVVSGSIMQAAVADGFLPDGVDVLPPLSVDDL
ncbi:hypothetical protein BC830DRAFT_1121011 [Chytriomyces sp. MP71]|nr:hypothetical protein BC830DRAFT_1121011 [Chytriomyces sp. MP71]